MKILCIQTSSGLNPNQGGGLTRYLNIIRKLDKPYNKIVFITTPGGFESAKRERIKSKYIVLKSSLFKKEEKGIIDRIISYFISTLHFLFALGKIGPTDIVYTSSDEFCDVIPAYLYKRRYNAKWVSMVHHKTKIRKDNFSSLFFTTLSSMAQNFSYYFITKFADALLTYKTPTGEDLKNLFIRNGFDKKKVFSVCNGLDFDILDKIPSKLKEYDACLIGGLRPGKGLYDVVPIWKNVVKNNPDAKLIVVGELFPNYREYLEKNIKTNNLQRNIIIKGGVSHKKTLDLIKKSRMLISCSLEEGWGIAIAEAIALSVPVISYDLPTISAIYPNIFIGVKPKDKKEFSKCILKLLKDKKTYNELIKKGKEYIRKYNWGNIAKEEYAIMRKVVSNEY